MALKPCGRFLSIVLSIKSRCGLVKAIFVLTYLPLFFWNARDYARSAEYWFGQARSHPPAKLREFFHPWYREQHSCYQRIEQMTPPGAALLLRLGDPQIFPWFFPYYVQERRFYRFSGELARELLRERARVFVVEVAKGESVNRCRIFEKET